MCPGGPEVPLTCLLHLMALPPASRLQAIQVAGAALVSAKVLSVRGVPQQLCAHSCSARHHLGTPEPKQSIIQFPLGVCGTTLCWPLDLGWKVWMWDGDGTACSSPLPAYPQSVSWRYLNFLSVANEGERRWHPAGRGGGLRNVWLQSACRAQRGRQVARLLRTWSAYK